MDAHTLGVMLLGGAGLALVVWQPHKIGKLLVAVAEAVDTLAVVFVALWLVVKGAAWLVKQIVTHPVPAHPRCGAGEVARVGADATA